MLFNRLWDIYQTPVAVQSVSSTVYRNSANTSKITKQISNPSSEWVCNTVDIDNITDCLETVWKTQKRYYHINIHFDPNSHFKIMSKVNDQLRVIIHILDSFCGKHDAYIDIVFSLTKKRYHLASGDLHICNMNSGYCQFGTTSTVSFKHVNRHIFIYRYEEWKKVLLHELVHYSDMHDYCGTDPYRLYEGYTETMATILNIVCCLYDKKQRLKTQACFFDKIRQHLQKERHHVEQIANVVNVGASETNTNYVAYYLTKAYLLQGSDIGLERLRFLSYVDKKSYRLSYKSSCRLVKDVRNYLHTKPIITHQSLKSRSISMRMTVTKW